MDAPTPKEVRAARIAAQLTQLRASKMFGYELRGWQTKESPSASRRELRAGEWHFLRLLAGIHPKYILAPRPLAEMSPNDINPEEL